MTPHGLQAGSNRKTASAEHIRGRRVKRRPAVAGNIARVVLGHSVRDLARQCERHDPVFAEVADDTALLDQFYITARYPNGLPAPAIPSESFTSFQSQTAQEAAEGVIRLVETFLRTHTDVLE